MRRTKERFNIKFKELMEQEYPNGIINNIDSFIDVVGYKFIMFRQKMDKYYVPGLYNGEGYIIDGYISPLYYSGDRDEVIGFSISLVGKDDGVSIDFR